MNWLRKIFRRWFKKQGRFFEDEDDNPLGLMFMDRDPDEGDRD